jgi:ABC-type molybdate transport system permease subunit
MPLQAPFCTIDLMPDLDAAASVSGENFGVIRLRFSIKGAFFSPLIFLFPLMWRTGDKAVVGLVI